MVPLEEDPQMNMHVKHVEAATEPEHKAHGRVLAAVGLQAAVPPARPSPAASERWVASWRFCPN